jgi:hypothetical protein
VSEKVELSGSYDLYNGTPPHESTSETSCAAAQSIAGGIGRLQGLVLDALTALGDTGSTDDELEVGLGIKHQTVSARRRELVLKGLVRNSGRTRLTRSKRAATVWVLGYNPTFSTDEGPMVVPTPEEIEQTLIALRDVYTFATQRGYPRHVYYDATRKVSAWLNRLARS